MHGGQVLPEVYTRVSVSPASSYTAKRNSVPTNCAGEITKGHDSRI